MEAHSFLNKQPGSSHCGDELTLEEQEENEHRQRSQHRGSHEQIVFGVIHIDHAREAYGEGEMIVRAHHDKRLESHNNGKRLLCQQF
jgi:hypothetical protein